MVAIQLGLGIYGGYYGGGVGIMMMAVWGLLDERDLKSMNAPRTGAAGARRDIVRRHLYYAGIFRARVPEDGSLVMTEPHEVKASPEVKVPQEVKVPHEMSAGPTAIEFWFEFASNYSYLSVMRIEQDAARLGVTILWRPFLLGPIFKSLGWSNSPFVLQTWKTAYVWRDMERECRKYGLAWTRPTAFPRASLPPARVALLGEVLEQLGLGAPEIISEAEGEANKLRLRNQTELARAKGIFGAPTFFVGQEMFWGNDRLDDALAYWGSSNGR